MRVRGLASLMGVLVVGCASAIGCATSTGNGSFDSEDGGTSNPSGKDGGSTQSGDTDSGRTPEGGNNNPGTCTAVTIPPAGTPGTNPGGSGCTPQSVSSFSPSWHPPTGAHQNKCSTTQISGYFSACLGTGSTDTACQSFSQSNSQCATCIVSQPAAASWGPLIQKNGIVQLNFAGCIALTEPCNETCARKVQAASQCGEASCDNVCPVTDQASFDANNRCQDSAATLGCKSYEAEAQCASALTGAEHPATACTTGSNFEARFNAIAAVFCGP